MQLSKPIKLDPDPGSLKIEDCPDHAHIAPNICFRSPLFGVCDQRKLPAVMDLLVATVGTNEVRYTGFRLSQSDLDIFAHLIRLARERQDETGWGQCSLYEVMKATGRSKGKTSRIAVMRSIKRLTASALSITFTESITGKRYSYCGSMVDDFLYDHERETYRFRVNTHVARMFGLGWSKIKWAQRLSLSSDLEKWLHGYFTSSHKTTYPLSVDKIRSLCGSGISQLRVFRSRLKAALNSVKAVGGISRWHIDKQDRVHVCSEATPPLPAQPVPDPQNKLPDNLREYIDKLVRPKAEQADDPEAYIAGALRRIATQGGLNTLDLEALQRINDGAATSQENTDFPGRPQQSPINEAVPHSPPGDVPPVWIAACEMIRKSIPDSVFNLWIEPLIARDASTNTIDLYGPDRFFCAWIADNYLPVIKEALTQTGQSTIQVRLRNMGVLG